MTESTTRIGMLSFAHMHAESYANSLKRIPSVEIVGVWDNNAEAGKGHAARHATAFFATPEALLREGLDAVVICTENVHHRPLVELAAGNVSAILCEKPIATTLEDGQAMIDL